MVQALIYTRISRDNKEGSGLGVQRQREDCEALAERLGWDVAAVYSDNDISAYTGKPRPGYEALLEDVRSGRADAVLVWHTDRLHRSPAELEHYIDTCQPRGVETQTVKSGHLDLATASGRMIARQLGVIARYEVEHMAERQRSAKLQAAESGRWNGGRRPFGFEPDGQTVRQSEAAEVLRAAEGVLAGESLMSIQRGWSQRGVLTGRGLVWHSADIGRMLRRPRYAGYRQHGGELHEAVWPAIIPVDQWRAVVSILTDPDRHTGGDGGRRYLGSGIYRCGVCGDETTVRAATSSRTQQPSYACRRARHLMRNAAHLDGYVQQVVIERLSRPDAKKLLSQVPEVDTAALRSEAAVLRERKQELAELHIDGHVSGSQLRIGTDRADTRLDEIETKLDRAAVVDPLATIIGVDDVESAWYGLELTQRRDILDQLVRVTLLRAPRGRQPGGGYFDPGSVRIEWRREG